CFFNIRCLVKNPHSQRQNIPTIKFVYKGGNQNYEGSILELCTVLTGILTVHTGILTVHTGIMNRAYGSMKVATPKYDNSTRKPTGSHRRYDKVAAKRMDTSYFQFSSFDFPLLTGHTEDLTLPASLPPHLPN
ncbi:hypothetical protein EZS27_022862, partial [termite gut metagenome]